MNIVKSLLARLQSRLDADGLSEKLLLLSTDEITEARKSRLPAQPINLVVGYSGSEKSQVALDLTLWMAYQTRLATSLPIIVHVVYVIEPVQSMHQLLPTSLSKVGKQEVSVGQTHQTRAQTAVTHSVDVEIQQRLAQLKAYEDADRILWEARSFAEKWKGDLSTHLRFGKVAEELATVLDVEEADVLILGCSSAQQPLIQHMKGYCPCPVVGIPT